MKSKLISLFLLISISFLPYAYADDAIEDWTPEELEESIIQTSAPTTKEPQIFSRHAVVLDKNSGRVLYEKDGYTRTPMASTTKIMTALVIIENCNLKDTVTISKKAGNTGGSRLGLHTGDKVTVSDLLYGLMLRSGNDAAVALAEFAAGSVEKFSQMMNQKAASFGLRNTNFTSPHGLDNDKHYTTAYELAILSKHALENETFQKIVGTTSTTIQINHSSMTIHNTNELLGNLNGVYGIKTGFTNLAGRCLVTSCKRNNTDIITVVLGADTKKIRTTDSVKLIEYTFANFSPYSAKKEIENYFQDWCQRAGAQIPKIKTNSELSFSLQPYDNDTFLIENQNDIHISVESQVAFLEAPIPQGYKVATLYLKNGTDTLLVLDITLASSLQKKQVSDYFKQYLFNYFDFLENAFCTS